MDFFARVYEVVKTVPKGKVISYGKIAEILGNKRMSRQVGWALHANNSPETVPCYRVVNRFGEVSSAFAFGGANAQRDMLIADGVEFDSQGRVKKEFFV